MTRTVEQIYASLPRIECKGLCSESCGPILYSQAEAARMAQHGVDLPSFDESVTCTALKNKRCSIYENRPYICRLWGAARKMTCPHGCLPSHWVGPLEDKMNMEDLGPLLPEHQYLLGEIGKAYEGREAGK